MKKSKLRDHLFLLTLLYPLYLTLGLLRALRILPRKYVIFGGRWGTKFSDNTKYLYLQSRADPSAVWITYDRRLVRELRQNGLEARHALSPQGIATLLQARIFLLSYSTFDLSPVFMLGVPVIQLWHGIGFKRIGLEADDWEARGLAGRIKNTLRKTTFRAFPHLNYMYCDHLSSLGDPEHLLRAFGLRKNQVLELGFPRLLVFDNNFWQENRALLCNQELEHLEEQRKSGKRIVVYMPTYRNRSSEDASSERIKMLDKVARHNNITLVFKAHHLDIDDGIPDSVSIYRHEDPYPLLRLADALITDYSSVMMDFLVTDRPIILFAYDLASYAQNEAGFNNDFVAFAPGTLTRTAEETEQALLAELAQPHSSIEKRNICKEFFGLQGFNSSNCCRTDGFRELFQVSSR